MRPPLHPFALHKLGKDLLNIVELRVANARIYADEKRIVRDRVCVRQIAHDAARDPAAAQALLADPKLKELISDPNLKSMLKDDALAAALKSGDWSALRKDPRITALLKDPRIAEQIKSLPSGTGAEAETNGSTP